MATDDRRPLAAVLWDMDGTVVDTEPYWMAAEHKIADDHGGTWTTEDAMNLVGNELSVSGRYLKDKLDLPYSVEEVVELLLDGVVEQVRHQVPWRPGARELLLHLRAAGVPCALVTMSYQRFVEPILEHLPEHTFDVVVTGDQVDNGKPHPEPYLRAAELLGVPIEDCVAIEDSPTGAASGLASGARVLAVPNHVPVPAVPGLNFRDSLVEVTVADLETLPIRDLDSGTNP
ncbi:HAD family phosphatase [Nocardioides sp. YIM 152588]|uniref:HAD family hydrolase n=1 Tax=Nocardioides sp. YIM 152588 TaxID=3158259 RepID=UPI0032E520E9